MRPIPDHRPSPMISLEGTRQPGADAMQLEKGKAKVETGKGDGDGGDDISRRND